jgi:twitching motility protein PilT
MSNDPNTHKLASGISDIQQVAEREAMLQRSIPELRESAPSTVLISKYLFVEALIEYATDYWFQPGFPVWVNVNKHWMIHPKHTKPLEISEFVSLLMEAFTICEETPIEFTGDTNDLQNAVIRKNDFAFHAESDTGNFYRFRGHVAKDIRGVSLNVRVLKANVGGMSALGFPLGIESYLLQKQSGMVIVAGATGSGKSTTIAALINHFVNLYPHRHLITLEDPVEYIFQHDDLLVHQKRIGVDVPGWAEGIVQAKREIPDVLVIGEMRTRESVHAAIEAAGSGILVFTTSHADSIPRTLDYIMEHFPSDQHELIRKKLSNIIRGIVVQALVPSIRNGAGYNRPELVYEVLLNSADSSTAAAIASGKWDRIDMKANPRNVSWQSRLQGLISERAISQETYELAQLR